MKKNYFTYGNVRRLALYAYCTLVLSSALLLCTACNDDDDGDDNKPIPIFTCEDNIENENLSEAEKALEDLLWNETLKYLEGFLEGVESTTGMCSEANAAITQTYTAELGGPQRECLTDKKDIQAMVKHIKAVLEFPDQARACFDAQRNYTVFPLYAPSEALKGKHDVAQWVGRTSLNEFFEKREGVIGEAGRELADAFEPILKKTKVPEVISQDITYNALPELWASVGWIPFYADNERALNDRFRGGYAYAEVMGPWGLLRVKAIDEETVGAEVGMTIQLGDTYYPYHYHDPQELYINLTPAECIDENQFMVMDWDNEAFRQTNQADGGVAVEVSAPEANWQQWYASHSVEKDWVTYFHRHAIHAFYVNKTCFDENDPSGLVTMWARTTAREHSQTTRICDPVNTDGRPVGPTDLFTCNIQEIIVEE